METWKDVVGYEGLYEVSNLGRVKSLITGRILKPGIMKRYSNVVLCNGVKKKTVAVHRIVAEAFCEKHESDTEVNHKNENTHDNRASNLEWCNRLYNIRYGTGIQKHAYSQRNRHGSKRILQYTLDGEFITEFPSIREASRKYGDSAFISRCAHKRCDTAYGYVWRFAN